MSDPTGSEESHSSRRAQLGNFLSVSLSQLLWPVTNASSHDTYHTGLTKSHDSLLKGMLSLEHTLGLGHKPNVIPPGESSISGPQRTVSIGWHPVAGMGGKWLAEKSGLGTMITKEIGKYPDPTQHWAVLVGDYVHELWMDEQLNVIYINERVDDGEEWRLFEVGKTRFSDEALREAGTYFCSS